MARDLAGLGGAPRPDFTPDRLHFVQLPSQTSGKVRFLPKSIQARINTKIKTRSLRKFHRSAKQLIHNGAQGNGNDGSTEQLFESIDRLRQKYLAPIQGNLSIEETAGLGQLGVVITEKGLSTSKLHLNNAVAKEQRLSRKSDAEQLYQSIKKGDIATIVGLLGSVDATSIEPGKLQESFEVRKQRALETPGANTEKMLQANQQAIWTAYLKSLYYDAELDNLSNLTPEEFLDTAPLAQKYLEAVKIARSQNCEINHHVNIDQLTVLANNIPGNYPLNAEIDRLFDACGDVPPHELYNYLTREFLLSTSAKSQARIADIASKNNLTKEEVRDLFAIRIAWLFSNDPQSPHTLYSHIKGSIVTAKLATALDTTYVDREEEQARKKILGYFRPEGFVCIGEPSADIQILNRWLDQLGDQKDATSFGRAVQIAKMNLQRKMLHLPTKLQSPPKDVAQFVIDAERQLISNNKPETIDIEQFTAGAVNSDALLYIDFRALSEIPTSENLEKVWVSILDALEKQGNLELLNPITVGEAKTSVQFAKAYLEAARYAPLTVDHQKLEKLRTFLEESTSHDLLSAMDVQGQTDRVRTLLSPNELHHCQLLERILAGDGGIRSEEKESVKQFLSQAAGDKHFNQRLGQVLKQGLALEIGHVSPRTIELLNTWTFKGKDWQQLPDIADRFVKLTSSTSPDQELEKLTLTQLGLLISANRRDEDLELLCDCGVLGGLTTDLLQTVSTQLDELETSTMKELRKAVRGGDMLFSSAEKKRQFTGRKLSGLPAIIDKWIASHWHAGKVYRPDEDRGAVAVAEVYGEDQISRGTLDLETFLQSDLFQFDPIPLIPKKYHQRLEDRFGENWQEEVRDAFSQKENSFYQNDIDIQLGDNFRQAGLSRYIPWKRWQRKKWDRKALNREILTSPSEAQQRMICSEFATKTTLIALIEIDQDFGQMVGLQPGKLINLPIGSREQLEAIHPGRLRRLLQESKCITQIGPPASLARVLNTQ